MGGETVGLITYMRTDGVQMAREAIGAIRQHVAGAYGPDYVPAAPREYTSKAKNAQEAHEAVRPTDVARTPDSVARALGPEQRRLYELIWKRAVASQMQSAELDQVAVEVTDGKGLRLRANGSIVAFDGFLKLYREDRDDAEGEAEEDGRMLPPMAERDPLKRGDVNALQHFTQPPPRFSEASLVKRMEELGIGRPSTYASILSVLQDRKYVRLEKRRFVPEDRGRLVTAFLTSFFEHYVETGFHRCHGGEARRCLRRADRLARGDARLLGGVLEGGRADQGAEDQRRDLGARPGSRAAFLPRARGRIGPPPLPRLSRRATGPKAWPVWQLHRLLELPRLPVHPPPRDRDRGGGRRDAEGGHPHPGPPPGDRGGDHGAARPVRALRAAGRGVGGQEGAEAAPHLAAARDGRRADHDRAGARPAGVAPRDRHSSRKRGSRSRPGSVASVPMSAWALCMARSTATTTC